MMELLIIPITVFSPHGKMGEPRQAPQCAVWLTMLHWLKTCHRINSPGTGSGFSFDDVLTN
jgi:hypothetical protein